MGVEFKSILYIPKEAPYDLYQDYYKKQNNLKLYVRRVMITDEFDELLPKYLGFIKGVVDSDSLPLNVSREMLQQNKVLKVIGKKMTRKALAMIKALADEDKKDDDDEEEGEVSKYETFWKSFGKYIKMGLIEDAANRTRLAKLLRYATSKSGDKEISLEDYVANMKEEQKNIYYISGEDKESLLKSPSVEKLLSKDIEIIFMTDSVDEYTVQHLTEYEGKRLINASREGLKLEEGDVEKRREDQYKELFKPLLDYTKELLGKKVEKVQISKHLVNSPVVVLSADYGWTAQMEKVMKSQAFADQSKFEFMKSKRMFEINPRHPMIVELNSRVKDSSADDATKDMVISLYLSGADDAREVQRDDHVLGGVVGTRVLDAAVELDNHRVARIDLEHALRLHELELALVSEGLALHHLLHLRSPAIVCREDDHGRVDEVLRDLHLLHLLAEQLLGVVEERLEELLVLLVPLLLDVALLELEPLARGVDEPLALVLGQVLHRVLVDAVGREDDLDVLGEELLHRGRLEQRLLVLARDVVDVLLVVLHVRHVVLQADLLLARLGGGVPQQLGQSRAVGGVLDEAHLDVLSEALPEGLVLGRLLVVLLLDVLVFLVLVGEGLDHREGLARHLLADDLEHLV